MKSQSQRASELHCPADKSILNWIRGVVVQTAAQMGFDGDELTQSELSVDEACANVVDHAYPEMLPGDELPLVVRLETEGGTLRITITDKGVGAGERRGGVQSIDEYLHVKRYRGLGTYIMQRFMDKVEFSQAPGEGTTVSMVKHLGPQENALGED